MLRERLLTGIRLWGVRRIQAATIARALAGTILLAVLFLWHWIAGAVTIGAAGVVYIDSRFLYKIQDRSMPPGRGWFFGGEWLPLTRLGVTGHLRRRQVIDELAGVYANGETVELLVWVTTTDRTGQQWTLVQKQFGDAIPSITASAVAKIAGACDPYVEAEQLVMAEIGVPLYNVKVIGWGVDGSLNTIRDTVVVVGETQAPAGSFALAGDNRSWHLVELHPDPVARALTKFDAGRWQAAAVWGLTACLDMSYPNARPLLEELVAEPWRNRMMFSRVGRLTESVTSGGPPRPMVDPVVMSVDHGKITERRQPRPRPTRALAWERPTQRTPTRYG